MSNTKLLLIFMVLAAIIGIVYFTDSRKGEGNFDPNFISIDTTKITGFTFYPKSHKGAKVRLVKEKGEWLVELDNKKAKVDNTSVSRIFDALAEMKSTMLAARTSDKWQEYEVDTAGTRVVIEEGNKTSEIVIGKPNFSQGGRNMQTYVRVKNSDDVHLVEGFLDPMFNTGIESWRNKNIIPAKKDEWVRLTFSSPSANYELVKHDTAWQLSGQPVDSISVENYLNSISGTTATTFADDVDASTPGAAQNVLEITNNQGDKIKVEGFNIGDRKVIRSSLNPENLFSGDDLFQKIFVQPAHFQPAVEEKNI